MLPTPATSYSKRDRDGYGYNNSFLPNNARSLLTRGYLLSRSRLTNLGAVLLFFSLTCSILYNVSWLLSTGPSYTAYFSSRTKQPPSSITSTISRSVDLSHLENLIVVAGHAIWTGCTADGRLDELNWILEEKQKGHGNVEAFFSHIEEGVRLLNEDENSLLVFSGGQTRPISLFTEGQSYHQLAVSSNLLNLPKDPNGLAPSQRVTAESFALDSFQNLLFSIARFKEMTGVYPKKITVIGFSMKKKRFEELHRAAIRWPADRFTYVGLDVGGDNSGEMKFGYTPYTKDLYGCHGVLLEKRRKRNPFNIFHPYHNSAPELAGLLEWCPNDRPTALYPESLPWSSQSRHD